ncbi:MAG: folate-binding protein [Solirubrobacterales bacterium]|nr:folate-binding protein [Solirubrobacterales bacterium]
MTEIELDGQYRALREAAGVLERERGFLDVSGSEAGEYLQGQLTNDVESLAVGGGCYSALLDRKGRMQGDMRVLRAADRFRIDTEPAGADAVRRHLSMYKVGRDVEIADRSGELALLSVIGPAASELALAGPLAPEHAHRDAAPGGIVCLAIATDTGIDLLVARDRAGALSEALVEAGAEAVSEAAAEVVRVEGGRPRFGREMSTATIPQEAGINERAVSFSKGCYIGQETVARLHYRGKPNRRLRGLRLAAPVADGSTVHLDERELGAVGTAVLSPARGPIALAILRREAELGATVEVGDEGVAAEVVELPF